MRTEIKLEQVYKILKNAIDELYRYHLKKAYTQAEVDLWSDLNRLYNLTPAYDNGFEYIENEGNVESLILEPAIGDEYRYVSEIELLRMFSKEDLSQNTPKLLGLPGRTLLDYGCIGAPELSPCRSKYRVKLLPEISYIVPNPAPVEIELLEGEDLGLVIKVNDSDAYFNLEVELNNVLELFDIGSNTQAVTFFYEDGVTQAGSGFVGTTSTFFSQSRISGIEQDPIGGIITPWDSTEIWTTFYVEIPVRCSNE